MASRGDGHYVQPTLSTYHLTKHGELEYERSRVELQDTLRQPPRMNVHTSGPKIYGDSGYAMLTESDSRSHAIPYEHNEAQQNLHRESDSSTGIYDFDPFQKSHIPGLVQHPWDTENLTQPDSSDIAQLFSPDSMRLQSKESGFSDPLAYMSPTSSTTTRQSNSPDSPGLLTPIQMDTPLYDNFHLSREPPIYQKDHLNSVAPLSIDGLYNMYGTSGVEFFANIDAATINPTDQVMFDFGTPVDSPVWKEKAFLRSPISSPILDEWNFSQAINNGISIASNLESATLNESKSTPTMRERTPATRSAIKTRSNVSDESFRIIGRQSLELDNSAREHPLYHNVSPQADGLYHCPWEKEPSSNCQHKPEKLKCNYDKFVDSHLKPYRCKILVCKDLHFSSTACLLRHEREAHAMHGHGDKPFLCTYEGCERGIPGNGFPRHWNLRDHMKRVHNDSGQAKSTSSGNLSPISGSNKARKRKAISDNPGSKRTATPQAISKQREPCLLERYNEKQQLLSAIVSKLEDPKNQENLPLLRKANDCIKAMVQISQRINSGVISGKQIG